MVSPDDFTRAARAGGPARTMGVTETAMPAHQTYRRVLLKISGEALMGDRPYGLDPGTVARIAGEVAAVHAMGIAVALVIGGGNIFRGLSGGAAGMERATADYMGMLATVINSLSMQSALEREGIATRVLSAIPMATVCEPYIRRDRKSTRLNSSHIPLSRMPSSA